MSSSSTILGGVNIAAEVNVAAGEAHLGEVGGNISAVGAVYVTTANQIFSQFNITGSLTITNILRVNGGTGTLKKVVVTDQQGICPDIDVMIFGAALAGAAETPVSLVDDSGYQYQGVVEIRVGDWRFSDTGAIATPSFEPFSVKNLGSTKNLFVVLVSKQTVQWKVSQNLRVFLSVKNN